MSALPLIALLCAPTSLLATTLLGAAQGFAVLGASTVTNASASTIDGDIGVASGTSITGLETVTQTQGDVHLADSIAKTAQTDAQSAFATLSAETVTTDLTGKDLGSVGVLTPGVYSFASSAELTGTLTLDFAGDANQPFVFEMGSTLTTASGSDVVVQNGGPSGQIYWVVGSSATLGTGTMFAGNIIADQSITLNAGAGILCGSAIALNGAVTLGGNSISDECGGAGGLGGARSDFSSRGFSGGGLGGENPPSGAVPEPATWAMLLVGMAATGAGLRRRSRNGRPAGSFVQRAG